MATATPTLELQMETTQEAPARRPLGIARQFVLAGRAIFTVENAKGEHYTFKVTSKEDNRITGRVVYFAWLLTGPDNTADYTYMGMILEKDLYLVLTKKSRYTFQSKPVKVFRWAMRVIQNQGQAFLPDGYTIAHAGHCGRCGRTLTHPESLRIGLGPECAGKMVS